MFKTYRQNSVNTSTQIIRISFSREDFTVATRQSSRESWPAEDGGTRRICVFSDAPQCLQHVPAQLSCPKWSSECQHIMQTSPAPQSEFDHHVPQREEGLPPQGFDHVSL